MIRRNGLIASLATFEDADAKSASSRRSKLATSLDVDRRKRRNGLTTSRAIFHDEDE